MKNKFILMAALVFSLFIGCQDDDYKAPNSFSDAGWYTSLFREAEMYVGIDNYISFSDLSQGTIDHKWTITPNSYYLEGPISRYDSIYDSFIMDTGSLESTDETVHVLFKEGGLKTVNLYNTFKDSVAFRGYKFTDDGNDENDYYTMPSVKVGNVWVIDTTFVIDVYDTIVPQILIRQNGIVVPHESASDVIEIEAGDNLEFVDITTTGRPNTRFWNAGGSTATDSLSVVTFKKLGDWQGTFQASRTGQGVPPDFDKYDIPATFRVIPSSKPFELFGDIVELENQTIQIPFNGEFVDFTGKESFFTVKVNDVVFPISALTLNSDDATILEIVLDDPIYRSDLVTVTLADGSGLESTDTRTPVAFTDVQVAMFQHEAVRYDFEDGGVNWTAYPENLPTTSIGASTEQAASGSYSMKVKSTASGNWSGFENLVDQFELKAGVTYQLEYKAYKVTGSTINMNGPFLKTGSTLFQFWNNFIKDAAPETWITISPNQRFTASGNDYTFFLRHNGVGTMYIDDIRIMEVDSRP